MDRTIELTVSIFLLVLGSTYLLQPTHWLHFLRDASKRPQGVFPLALALVLAGVFIASAYNNWSSTWPIFITVLGWLAALEGALILLFPGVLKHLASIPDKFIIGYLRVGGSLLVVLGALLLRNSFR